ncbi:MAG: type I secretion system permease/ATPase [Hyphomicrobiales bacterium]|nr:type I secretion system permease/ATPase [Hyphomicrobiales bacterium]
MVIVLVREAKNSRRAVRAALQRSRMAFRGVALFTAMVNVLALTGSLYMLQIYDRVIPSRSLPTLVGLTIIMIGLFCAHGLLDLVRGRVLARIGARFDEELRQKTLDIVLAMPFAGRSGSDASQAVRDLDSIRNFLWSPGPTAFFDIPWVPLYLGLIFALHPMLGSLAAGGAIFLVILTLLTEFRTAAPLKAAAASGAERAQFFEMCRRNAELVRAHGMAHHLGTVWHSIAGKHLDDQLKSSDAASGLGTISKIVRMLLQSAILGLGAYLVIEEQASAGVIIAASIMTSRALAPIEIVIGNWKNFVGARQARTRLEDLCDALPDCEAAVDLPPPNRKLSVQDLSVASPGDQKLLIHNINFEASAGDVVGIIGPSASGKSTLVRALVGAWRPATGRGFVRLDGAPLDQWNPLKLGRHIGYLPQEIELFYGTIAQNICRFDPEAESERIIAAAQNAGVHDMILNLPDGYGTRVGDRGNTLSAGQRQRIALARAVYGEPFLIVLDEPNSNLDAEGDNALSETIKTFKSKGRIVIVVAHRPSALLHVDKVLALANGQVAAFGSKEEVLRKVIRNVAQRSEPMAAAE